MTCLKIRERRIGAVSILDANADIRIGVNFGARVITLSKAVQSLLDEGRNQIILNLAQVPSIGNRGLTELVSAAAVTNRDGGLFKIAHLNERVLRMLKKAQLLTYLDVFEVESQAIDSFPGSLSQSSHGNIS